MKSAWGKVGKNFAMTCGSLICVGVILDAVFLRATDIGEMLGRESEIQSKAKGYEMPFTLEELNRSYTFPEGENAGPTLQKACGEFSQVEKQRNKPSQMNIFGSFKYVKTGLFRLDFTKDDLAEIEYFRPHLKKFIASCDPVLDRLYCSIKRDWSNPLSVVLPEYRSLSLVHRLLQIDLVQSSKSENANELAKKIRFLNRFRRCCSNLHEWLWSVEQFNLWQKEDATFILEALKSVSRPNVELGKAVRENLMLKNRADFKTLCRMYFFVGADGFPPKTDDMTSSASRIGIYAKLPHVEKAWKLRIQLAAVQGYEAGMMEKDAGIAFLKANETFKTGIYRAGISNLMPAMIFGGGLPVSTSKTAYDLGPVRVKDWLIKHGF